LLREQMRIQGVRMSLIPSNQRPHHPSQERMAILELKATRGWSLQQTAKAFLVTPATIASWMKRLSQYRDSVPAPPVHNLRRLHFLGMVSF
jgi:predicted RNA polymerase sigma factor